MIYFYCLLLTVAAFSLMTFKILIDLKELEKIKKETKIKHNEMHMDMLFNIGDTRAIYDYFLKTQTKLPLDLHNMMVGKAIGDDFHARMYLTQLDSNGEMKSIYKTGRFVTK